MVELELAIIIGILVYGGDNVRSLYQEHLRRIKRWIGGR